MKSPPIQYTDDAARDLTDAFIAGHGTSSAGHGTGSAGNGMNSAGEGLSSVEE